MEHISKLVSQAGQEKSLATTSQPSQPQWGAILWTLAQTRHKELSVPEIKLWQAKLSGYPNELVEWALLNYNGEFFPNPSTICRMIEVKREAIQGEQQDREWKAWKAGQKQAAAEGKLATDEDYTRLREIVRRVAFGPTADGAQVQDRGGMDKPNIVGLGQPENRAVQASTTKD